MFGKIVAISTVKHLSRNYASFSNQVCKSGIAYPLLVRRKISRMDTADFHGDGYILQNTGLTKDLRIAFVVCDVNSEKEQLQVKIFVFEKSEETLAMRRQNWLYAIDQKQRKTVIMHKYNFQTGKPTFSCPCESLCCPCVQF